MELIKRSREGKMGSVWEEERNNYFEDRGLKIKKN